MNQALLVRHTNTNLFSLSLVSENVSRRALRFSECGILMFEHLRVLALYQAIICVGFDRRLLLLQCFLQVLGAHNEWLYLS